MLWDSRDHGVKLGKLWSLGRVSDRGKVVSSKSKVSVGRVQLKAIQACSATRSIWQQQSCQVQQYLEDKSIKKISISNSRWRTQLEAVGKNTYWRGITWTDKKVHQREQISYSPLIAWLHTQRQSLQVVPDVVVLFYRMKNFKLLAATLAS